MKISITIVAYRNYSDILAAVKSIQKFSDPGLDKSVYIVDNSMLTGSDEQSNFIKELKNPNDINFQNTIADTDNNEYIDKLIRNINEINRKLKSSIKEYIRILGCSVMRKNFWIA